MQKIIIATFLLAFVACKNSSDKSSSAENGDTVLLEETNLLPPEERLPWKLSYDSLTGNFRLQQQTKLSDSATAAGILADINMLWPEIEARYQKTSSDTIFIRIPDSEYLTQRMGSSGPPGYMALVTYVLTELPGIRYVDFNFEEGDHAIPGVFSREDFKNSQ